MNKLPMLRFCICILALLFSHLAHAQKSFVHPGISHKKSDLDRMKHMVEARIDPWYSSYQTLVADSKSSFDYTVRGEPSFTELGRDNKVNYNAWNSDIRAAYYNAIRWYITGDTRHADKAVEIFKAWSNLTAVTSNGTESLSGGVGYIMIEAAEIIKSTYDGWAPEDLNAFKAMLVYPGYSNTAVPDAVTGSNATFYWKSYQGDPGRHGNQGLSGWRTVMAIGIFLDNEIIYDRALRYIQGLPHRADDLAYPAGPGTSVTLTDSGDYADTYSNNRGTSIEDYGYNEVMTHYIWENGQCQESSRDQQHVFFGLGLLCSLSEMAWNQGYDLYSHAEDRLLLGLEYNMRYNVSHIQSYSDQPNHWEPTVASGEFIQRTDRTGRWYSKAISPIGIGEFSELRPIFEMPVAHYLGRGLKTEDEIKWILRARDKSIELSGYERAGWTNDAIGWGGLGFRRPDGCFGDPINGFDANGLPRYEMNVLPYTIEAENFDHFPGSGKERTYHDKTDTNSGGHYRLDDAVDITLCSEGGHALTGLESDEWLTYTVALPSSTTYGISIRYAAAARGGKIKFSFDGVDATGEVDIPFGESASSSLTDWQDLQVATDIPLSGGVQAMKVSISGSSNAFELNSFSFTKGPDPVEPELPTRAHWKLDEGSGEIANDSSGNNFHGTITTPDWIVETDRRALDLNGSTSTVNIPPAIFDTIENEISISMWIKGDDTQPLPDSLFHAVDASNRRILNIHLPFENSTVYWDAGDNNGYDRINKTATDAEFKGDWSHWVFTKNATHGTMFIYRNGELWHSGTGKSNTITGITSARIGSDHGDRYYTGGIDDVRIYDSELTGPDIQELYAIDIGSFEFPTEVDSVEIEKQSNGAENLVVSIPDTKRDFFYQIKSTSSLYSPTWTDLNDSQPGNGDELQIRIPLQNVNPDRYYKVVEKNR